MLRLRLVLLAGLGLALTACHPKEGATPAVKPAAGDAKAVATLRPGEDDVLKQGWDKSNRDVWYDTTQGSRLIPLAWLLALEDKAGDPLFTEANVKAWGYLPRPDLSDGRRQLPIGFTRDIQANAVVPWRTETKVTDDDRAWVGMNCAACHTAQLTFAGQTFTVDGGPALSDFEGFTKAVYDALAEADKDANFGRFADRVLRDKPLDPWVRPGLVDQIKDLNPFGPKDDQGDRKKLHDELKRILKRETELRRLNDVQASPGYGRLDAFGHIFNKVAWMVEKPGMAPQDVNRASAPVSYPFLWNVPQHDKVQWNGIAPKIMLGKDDVGSLIRNAGEVVGVFADIQVVKNDLGYPSSINATNLKLLEKQLVTLKPPKWPDAVFHWNEDVVGPAGTKVSHQDLVNHGKDVYLHGVSNELGKARGCVACHKLIDRDDLKTPIVAQMSMVNPDAKLGPNEQESARTDIWMACNAYAKTAQSGWMQGVPSVIGGKFHIVGPRADLSEMTTIAVLGALGKKLGQLDPVMVKLKSSKVDLKQPLTPGVAAPGPAGAVASPGLAAAPGVAAPRAPSEDLCLSAKSPILAYKGRPLNGIWATAPYLHNGSVRTLWQLLLPAEERETSFDVGSREFDPTNVGFVSGGATNRSTLVARRNGTPVPGDSNAGHDYGNKALTPYDRWALIEYLKTL